MIAIKDANGKVVNLPTVAEATPVHAISDKAGVPITPAQDAYVGFAALTPDLPAAPGRALQIVCTTGGMVSITMGDGSNNIIPVSAMFALQILPFAVKAINSAGTTAIATYGNLI